MVQYYHLVHQNYKKKRQYVYVSWNLFDLRKEWFKISYELGEQDALYSIDTTFMFLSIMQSLGWNLHANNLGMMEFSLFPAEERGDESVFSQEIKWLRKAQPSKPSSLLGYTSAVFQVSQTKLSEITKSEIQNGVHHAIAFIL